MGIKRSGSAAKALQTIRGRLGRGELLRVGFLEKARYSDGTFVASVAAWNEFGVPERHQPPRPFFRIAIDKASANWGHNFGVALQSTNFNLDASFRLVGEQMQGDIKASIIALWSPPLAKSTILARAKGAKHGAIDSPTIGKPLIHTGHMLNSVDYDVQGGL
jgi:hypothetical protein